MATDRYNRYSRLYRPESLFPNFKIANATIHFDESSPHLHIIGVAYKDGNKNGMYKQVGKATVFNKESLILYFQVHKDIRYDWRGDKIGGLPPAEWNCYTTDGKIDYDKMAVNPIFVSGIESIVKANAKSLKNH